MERLFLESSNNIDSLTNEDSSDVDDVKRKNKDFGKNIDLQNSASVAYSNLSNSVITSECSFSTNITNLNIKENEIWDMIDKWARDYVKIYVL